MSIAVVCPQCCQSYQVDGSLAGTAVQCRCGARFGIPAAEPVRQMAAATREPLAVTCPHCLARFSAPPHLLGQAASCPSCALTFCVTPEATTDAWQPALNSGTCGAGGAAPLPTDSLEVIEDLPVAPAGGVYLRRRPRKKRQEMSEFACYVAFSLLFLASIGGFLICWSFEPWLYPELLANGLMGMFIVWLAAYLSGYGLMMRKAGKSMFSRSAMFEAAGVPKIPITLYIISSLAYSIRHHEVSRGFARRFRKSPRFALGLTLLPMIFYPVLGFGPAKYHPPR